MRIAIVGFDLEGRSSYKYFSDKKHELVIHDQDAKIKVPKGAKTVLGPTYLDNLDSYDLIVRTPGLHPQKILDKNPGVADKITSQVNEFFRVSPTRHIIGVTGTKGKGTTSTLIQQMLRAAGKNAYIGANIGIPPLSFIKELQADDWVILELSSFQLIDLKFSPHIATVLTIMPEHLNWHHDMDEYIQAKKQLFTHQSRSDIAIYYDDNDLSHAIASSSSGDKISYYAAPGAYVEDDSIKIDGQVVCKTDEVRLLGAHNWQNICAAVTTVWQAGVLDVEPLRSVITSFSGLSHRLQHVRDRDEIAYYDDSFATTPESAMVAIAAFKQPKVVIIGGSDKGVELDVLADAVAESSSVRHAICIGQTGPRLADLLSKRGFTSISEGGKTMVDIVNTARQHAKPGDVVLLSTGCASFDMFQDYKDRGNQFKQAVYNLPSYK